MVKIKSRANLGSHLSRRPRFTIISCGLLVVLLVQLRTVVPPEVTTLEMIDSPRISSLDQQAYLGVPGSHHEREVSCPAFQRYQQQQHGSSGQQLIDPNRGKVYKRKTITQPPFWVALHNKKYDELRWVTIMDKGEYYEKGITGQFQEILSQKPKGIVIDVGMNIGWYTLLARSLGHNVVAFEPNPFNIMRMCESTQLNGWGDWDNTSTNSNSNISNKDDDDVRMFQVGLGSQPEMLTLTIPYNPGMATFHEDKLTQYAKSSSTRISVPVTTLDEFAEEMHWMDGDSKQQTEQLPIYLLKADVEGHELPVFRGAQKLIQHGRIENILYEYSSRNRADLQQYLTLLLKASYELRSISDVYGVPKYEELAAAISSAKIPDSEQMVDLSRFESTKGFKEFMAEKDAANMWWVRKTG